jgi:hypothetical protein
MYQLTFSTAFDIFGFIQIAELNVTLIRCYFFMLTFADNL